jgi:hypothetical protein
MLPVFVGGDLFVTLVGGSVADAGAELEPLPVVASLSPGEANRNPG